MQVVSISSLKGGVGKTSVTTGLASAALAAGIRTLVVDLDPHADATTALGVQPGDRFVAIDGVRPNGLAFSLDERLLYLSDTGRGGGAGGPPDLRVFAVADDGTLDGGRLFATPTAGSFDGFRLDEDGRVWTSAGDGVHCYDPDGTLLRLVQNPS